MVLYEAMRPLLFRVDAERIHEFVVRRLERANRSPRLLRAIRTHYVEDHPSLATECWGLRFPNPIGMAAGFDKNARLTKALPALGFGFVEIGTVTSEPQEGNPRPRVFRLPRDRALINRLGFNNEGAETVRARLAKLGPTTVPLGVNIGKLKVVANEDAPGDYVKTFEKLHPYGSYFVVNVSSPNTPGLRDLQARSSLVDIVTAIKAKNAELAREQGAKPRPLLVKIAPDLDEKELHETVATLQDLRVDGIVATNTTTDRSGLQETALAAERGGLSGEPLRERSTEVVRRVFEITDGHVPVVGVGGIFRAEDALEKIKAGASLVQMYTGFIYGGPGTPSGIAHGLAVLLEREGFASVADAVGVDAQR